MLLKIARVLLACLFCLNCTNIFASAESNKEFNTWHEVVLYRDLMRIEVHQLKSIPKDFSSPYKTEISSKTKSMVLLDTILRIKSGLIVAKGEIPKKFKSNPFADKFNSSWNSIISTADNLKPIDCKKNSSDLCQMIKSEDRSSTLEITTTMKHTSIFTKINGYIVSHNWPEALRYTYKLSEMYPRHNLTYDIIQRVYSLVHQGSGDVAIKGI